MEARLKKRGREQFSWVLAAGLSGFAASAVFAGALRLPRSLFVLPYSLLAGAFLYIYFRRSGVDLLGQARRRPLRGLIGALAVAVFTVGNMLWQPASSPPRGAALIFETR